MVRIHTCVPQPFVNAERVLQLILAPIGRTGAPLEHLLHFGVVVVHFNHHFIYQFVCSIFHQLVDNVVLSAFDCVRRDTDERNIQPESF